MSYPPSSSRILSPTTENISIYYTALCKQAKCGDQDVIVVAEEGALDDDDDDAAAADEDMYVHAYCYIGSWNTQIPSVTDPIFDVPCTTEHSRAHLLASDEAWIKIHERCAFGKSKHVIFVHSGWDNAAAMAPPSLLWDCAG